MTDSPPNLTPSPTASPQLKTPAVSVWSLILGILSIFCLWILGSIPAIILGIIGMKKAGENPQEVGGKGLALAGIITGGVGILTGLATVGIYASLMIPALSGVQTRAEEAKVMANMRQAVIAIQAYTLDNNDSYPTSLEELIPDYLTSPEILKQTDTETGESAEFLYRPPASTVENPYEVKLLMSPFPINGKRVVGYADGRVESVEDSLFNLDSDEEIP